MPLAGGCGEFGVWMTRQANAVDFWRGFALVSIFVNHIPGIFYERLTHRNLSISDSAELFVFLAGWSLGLLVGSRKEQMTAARLVSRLGGRALQIYAAQILISSIALVDEQRSRELLLGKVRRLVFSTGFFRVRDLRISADLIPGEIYVPYWVGFRGRGMSAQFTVLDAVRRKPEGAKVTQLLQNWLTSTTEIRDDL